MVKIMEHPTKIHDLGGFSTPIFGNTQFGGLEDDALVPAIRHETSEVRSFPKYAQLLLCFMTRVIDP